MKPRLVVQVKGVVAAKQKIARAETVESRRVHVIIALANSDRLLHQQSARHYVGPRHAVEAEGIGTGNRHARLKQDESAHRCEKAVRVQTLVHVQSLLFQTLAV